ncbi:hypothetical protein SAMN02910278_01830 [Peptostreptococcus sp. D1]|nr:hypothetical protein SAMN02910278_01830 [Peptostreptococcus sp. D1]
MEKIIALTISVLTIRQLVLLNQKSKLEIKKLKLEIKNLKRRE